MVPDLPVELWSEVLSNLPQGTLPNMIGINRYLFETGMNELYEEINLAADMKVGRYVEQLQNPNITSRVRRLHVNATFGPFQPPKPRFNRKVATRIRKWYSRSEKPILSNLLIGVLDGLRRCINLREVTIEVLPGSIMTSVCSEFLDKLAQGLGSRVHVLNVNVEISSWQRHVPIARALTNLTTLKIELHSRFYPLSRREPSLELGVLCIQDLGNLVASVRETLTTFVVITHHARFRRGDIEELFPTHAGLFPNLRHLKFEFSMYGMRLGHPEQLAKFIGHCSPNLNCIELVPDGNKYGDMVPGGLQKYALLLLELKTMTALSLRVLVVSLSHREITSLFTMLAAGFAPKLQKLTVIPSRGHSFGYEEFSSLVESVVKGGSGNTLEELHIRVRVLSPAHLSLLYNHFPRLQSLYLDYWFLSTSPNDIVQPENPDVVFATFRKQVNPDWSKRKLDFKEMGFDPTFSGYPDRELQHLIVDGLGL